MSGKGAVLKFRQMPRTIKIYAAISCQKCGADGICGILLVRYAPPWKNKEGVWLRDAALCEKCFGPRGPKLVRNNE